jgi:hypothetical protein
MRSTRVWLNELSRQYGRPITPQNVPEQEWDALASFGLTLSGSWAWGTQPAGIAIATGMLVCAPTFSAPCPTSSTRTTWALPIAFVNTQSMSISAGQAWARCRAKRLLLEAWLILDFVPNHVAPDHPWVSTSRIFIQGTPDDLTHSRCLL